MELNQFPGLPARGMTGWLALAKALLPLRGPPWVVHGAPPWPGWQLCSATCSMVLSQLGSEGGGQLAVLDALRLAANSAGDSSGKHSGLATLTRLPPSLHPLLHWLRWLHTSGPVPSFHPGLSPLLILPPSLNTFSTSAFTAPNFCIRKFFPKESLQFPSSWKRWPFGI